MGLDFEFHRPENISAAISLKCTLGSDAVFWAGGTDLILQCHSGKRRVGHCIDLTALRDLSFIEDGKSSLSIGALTPLSDLERFESNTPHLQTLSEVAKLMCTVQTRTLATIGGNLCNASPAADLIAPLIAMGAVAKLEGHKGVRELAVENLMISPGKTALHDGELILEIVVPKDSGPVASAYRRIDRTVVDIALVSAATSITLDDNSNITTARVALGAVAPRVIRSPGAEALLLGCSFSDLKDGFLAEVGAAASADATPITDVRAGANYRKAMIKVLVERALKANCEKLKEQLS